MKILLADDDGDLLDGMVSALRHGDFTVITARDGEQALQRWEAEQPDVVVLEADLPGLSGRGVCQQIRARGATPVVLLSSALSAEHIVQAFRAGADDYIVKPVSPQELTQRIRAVWGWAADDLTP